MVAAGHARPHQLWPFSNPALSSALLYFGSTCWGPLLRTKPTALERSTTPLASLTKKRQELCWIEELVPIFTEKEPSIGCGLRLWADQRLGFRV